MYFQIESELTKICEEVLDLLSNTLIPVVEGEDDESEVFYKKMYVNYRIEMFHFHNFITQRPLNGWLGDVGVLCHGVILIFISRRALAGKEVIKCIVCACMSVFNESPISPKLLQLDFFVSCHNNCIPDAKRGYYGFIIVVVRVRRDFLLATYSPHFFPDFFHIWQVA